MIDICIILEEKPAGVARFPKKSGGKKEEAATSTSLCWPGRDLSRREERKE